MNKIRIMLILASVGLSQVVVGAKLILEEDPIRDKYVEAYVVALQPSVEASYRQKFPDEHVGTIKLMAESSSRKVGACSYEALALYPAEYREVVIASIIETKDLYRSADEVNMLIDFDMQSGKITKEAVAEMAQETKQLMTKCIGR